MLTRSRILVLVVGSALGLSGGWCIADPATPTSAPVPSEAVKTLISELGEILESGRADRAVEHAKNAMEVFDRTGDRLGQAFCLAFLATQNDAALDFETTASHYGRSLDLLEEVHHSFAAAAVSRVLGTVLQANGELERAELVLRRGLGLLEEFARSGHAIPGPEYWLFSFMLGLPFELSELSDPFSDATREMVIQKAESSLRTSLGAVLSWRNRLDEASVELERALALSRSTGGQETETRFLLNVLALHRQKQGRYEEARKSFEEALLALKRQPADPSVGRNRRERINLYENLEQLDVAHGRRHEAWERNRRMLEEARTSGDQAAEAMLLKSQARLLQSFDRDFQGAAALLAQAWEKAQDLQDPYLETQDTPGIRGL